MWIAKIALIAWVPITAIVAQTYRPAFAGAVLMIGSVLFLPTRVGFDFPLVPPMGRQEIAGLSLLAFVFFHAPGRILRIRPGWGVDSLLFILLLGGVGTVLTNADTLTYGPRVIQGMRPFDGVSDAVRDVIRYGVPFLLGRALFRTSRDLRTLMIVFVGAALLYTLLILIELRLSPQLNRWVYGFHPQRFLQHVRWGGYRPMVFLGNGLVVSMFIATASVMAASLARARLPIFQMNARLGTGYLAGILVACKSYASMSYGLIGIPLVSLCRPSFQVKAAAGLVILALLYPIARTYDVFPVDDVVSAASMLSVDRAQSLDYRFRNEDILLAKAQERVLFGWGGFKRNRVFDPRGGGGLTITDGYWIIMLGQRGIFGVLSSFGFVVLPVLITYRRFGRLRDPRDRILVAGLSVCVALMTVDLLPNGLFTHLPIFMSGALLGVMQGMTATRRATQPRRAAVSDAPGVAGPLDPDPLAADDPVGAPGRRPWDGERPSSLAGARNLRRLGG